jgi:hypothetical protein
MVSAVIEITCIGLDPNPVKAFAGSILNDEFPPVKEGARAVSDLAGLRRQGNKVTGW